MSDDYFETHRSLGEEEKTPDGLPDDGSPEYKKKSEKSKVSDWRKTDSYAEEN